jgi:aspartyl/asparaginyl beta-hydroxylase (cupin superfamily)
MVSRKLVAGAVILAVPIGLCAIFRPDRAGDIRGLRRLVKEVIAAVQR